jgi:hypothetical protein
MSRKVTENGSARLEPRQLIALESILSGATATAAAKLAGVDRRTLWRWMRSDFEFQAALNRARRDMWESAEIRLGMLADSAIGVVEQAVAQGDLRTSVLVLRGLGLLDGEPMYIGPEDASILASNARTQEAVRISNARNQESDLRRRLIMEDLLLK